jgi:hypothetical protein
MIKQIEHQRVGHCDKFASKVSVEQWFLAYKANDTPTPAVKEEYMRRYTETVSKFEV